MRWIGEVVAIGGALLSASQVLREEMWQFGLGLGISMFVLGGLIALDARDAQEATRRPGYLYRPYDGGTDGE